MILSDQADLPKKIAIMDNEKRLTMSFYRPKLGVGTKTLIALSVMFWVPVVVLTAILLYLFQGLISGNISESLQIELRGAKLVYEERGNAVQAALNQMTSVDSTKKAFSQRDASALRSVLYEFGKRNPHVEILAVVDENQRVIARRSGKTGDYINVGDILSRSLISGESTNSVEMVGGDVLAIEEAGHYKQIKDRALVQYVVSPVRYNEKIAGAIVAGMVLTGNPWLGNTIYNRFGVEMALFGGEPAESAFLHATSSVPRSTWVNGQAIPRELGMTMSLGKPFIGTIGVAGVDNLLAYEPLKDSRNRIIGAIGVSRPARDVNAIVISALGKGVVVAAVIGLIIAGVLTFFIYNDITKPLGFLVGAMDEVAAGSFNVVVDLKTGDQFEQLAGGFNHMVHGIMKREERLKKHNEVAKLLMSTLDLRELLERMLKIVIEVTDSQMGIVYLYDEVNDTLTPHVQYGTQAGLKSFKKGEGYPGLAVQNNKQYILTLPKETAEPMEMGFTQLIPAEVAYIPLSYQEKIMGVLVLGGVNKYTEDEVSLFDYLASQISIALDNAIMHHKIQELSLTDPLTGLYNRRYLNARLEEEWARSIRHNKPVSILLSDADNFKSVNDGYGHDRGDEVLKAIARSVKENVRKDDLAARYGGEEFVIVLVDTKADEARKIAEKILSLSRANIYPWMGRAVTLSIGVATFPDTKVENFEELIQAADKAMYMAKTSGKNKVVMAEGK